MTHSAMVLCESRDARYYESAQASVAPPFWEGLGVGVGAPNPVTLGPFLLAGGTGPSAFQGVCTQPGCSIVVTPLRAATEVKQTV